MNCVDFRLGSCTSQPNHNQLASTVEEMQSTTIKSKKSLQQPMSEKADENFAQSIIHLQNFVNDRINKGLMSKFRSEVMERNACRIYGPLEIHKLQGDFHITPRDMGNKALGTAHLDHESIFLMKRLI